MSQKPLFLLRNAEGLIVAVLAYEVACQILARSNGRWTQVEDEDVTARRVFLIEQDGKYVSSMSAAPVLYLYKGYQLFEDEDAQERLNP